MRIENLCYKLTRMKKSIRILVIVLLFPCITFAESLDSNVIGEYSYEIIELDFLKSRPRLDGLLLDSKGNLLIACEGDSKLVRLSTDGRITVLMDASDGLCQPEDIAMDAEGNIFVSDDCAHSIFKLKTDGTVERYLGPKDGLIQPEGMVFDNRGTLFVAEEEVHVIYKVGQDKIPIIAVDCTSGLVTPEDIAMDARNNLYILDDDGGCIMRISAQGRAEILIDRKSGVIEPEAFFLRGTEIFFTDSKLNKVFLYSLKTGKLRTICDAKKIEGIRGLQGIEVSRDGTIYVSCDKGRILKLFKKHSF